VRVTGMAITIGGLKVGSKRAEYGQQLFAKLKT
jgi:hypothetical protein